MDLFSTKTTRTSLAAASLHCSQTLRTVPLATWCLHQANTAVMKPLNWTLETTHNTTSEILVVITDKQVQGDFITGVIGTVFEIDLVMWR